MASVVELIEEAARRHGVDTKLAIEVARAESNFNQSARSSAGAIGVMQLMPATARELGVDPFVLEENIEGGVRYLRQQLQRFGGNIVAALAAYNWGPTRVANALAQGGNWLLRAPQETQQYVRQIISRIGVQVAVTAESNTPIVVAISVSILALILILVVGS